MTGIDAGASATDSTRTSTSMLAVLRPALRARARRVLPVLAAACLVAGCDLPGSQQAGGPAASPAPHGPILPPGPARRAPAPGPSPG